MLPLQLFAFHDMPMLFGFLERRMENGLENFVGAHGQREAASVSGSIFDHAQFGCIVHNIEHMLDCRHNRVLKGILCTVFTHQNRQVFNDDNGSVAVLKRQVCCRPLHLSTTNSTSHGLFLILLKSDSHSRGLGRYTVTTLILSPSTSVAI